MKKKGTASTDEAIKWILGLIVVAVVVSILLGPKNLYAQARDSIINTGSGLIPGERSPEISGKSRIPQELENYFDSLISKIKNSGSGEICRIEIGKIPKAQGFSIGLYEDKAQIWKKDERGDTPPEKTAIVEGLKPCSVKGPKTKRFYSCLINAIRCTDAYNEEKIGIGISEDTTIAPFLFKFDKSHLCAIYLDGLDFTPGCNEINDLIDNACVEKIRKTYPTCDIPASPKKQFDECGAIDYCYNEINVKNARPDLPCLPSTPVAFFYTKEDCIKGSACIKEHTSKISINICDDSNKNRNIWEWPKYFGR